MPKKPVYKEGDKVTFIEYVKNLNGQSARKGEKGVVYDAQIRRLSQKEMDRLTRDEDPTLAGRVPNQHLWVRVGRRDVGVFDYRVKRNTATRKKKAVKGKT